MFGYLLWATLAFGGNADKDLPSTWVRLPSGFPACASGVVDGPKVKKKEREALRGIHQSLQKTVGDPTEMDSAIAVLDTLKPHPAVDSLRTVFALAQEAPEATNARAQDLATEFGRDACVLTTASVSMIMSPLGAADPVQALEAVGGMLGRAWILEPKADIAWVLSHVYFVSDNPARAEEIVQKGLELDPDHLPLRKLRAMSSFQTGGIEAARGDLLWLAEHGDTELLALTLELHWADRDLDQYVQLAARLNAPPLSWIDGLEQGDDAYQKVRDALGLTSDADRLWATLVTPEGDIRCELMPDVAPLTVANFVGLSTGQLPWIDPATLQKQTTPLYNDVVFHRVIPEFMIQGGDPTGTGRGGPGYNFRDELRSELTFDKAGRLAMANSGPNTNGSQFFITDGPTHHLDGRHTIFGQCVDTKRVSTIAALQGPNQDQPTDRLQATIQTIRIEVGELPAADTGAGDPGLP